MVGYADLVLMKWTGEAMRPASRFWEKRADDAWTIGELYMVDAIEGRSAKSHRHYFAAIHECWINISDGLLEIYPSPEHLRKRALILKGYRHERSIICASTREAQRMAAFISPMDDYAIVSVNDEAVVVWTAKSQSTRAMGGKEFQESKQAVLDFCATLIGVKTTELENAE